MEKPNLKSLKDKSVIDYIEYLESELSIFKKSPNVESYLTVYNQVSSFNTQLQLGEQKTEVGEDGIKVTVQAGFVDLFASKDDKSFDRTKWYFENILQLNKTLAELRKLMTPEDIKNLNKKMPLSEDSAENYLKK